MGKIFLATALFLAATALYRPSGWQNSADVGLLYPPDRRVDQPEVG
jgi:hypothetical protein